MTKTGTKTGTCIGTSKGAMTAAIARRGSGGRSANAAARAAPTHAEARSGFRRAPAERYGAAQVAACRGDARTGRGARQARPVGGCGAAVSRLCTGRSARPRRGVADVRVRHRRSSRGAAVKSEHGTGTVRTVRDRAGNVIGYQAILPRALSLPPRGCKRPDRYREPVGRRGEAA